MPSTSRRLAALTVALVATGGLALAGTAAADPAAPVIGTTACDTLVSAQTAVATLQVQLNGAIAAVGTAQSTGEPPATITPLQTVVNTLTAQLSVLKLTTAQQLCTPADTTPAPTTTTAPPETTTTAPEPTDEPLPAVTVGSILAEIDKLDCWHYGDQLAAIQADEIRLVQSGASTDDAVKVSDALKGKEDALNCAGSTSSTPAPPVVVTTTIEVPETNTPLSVGSNSAVRTVPNTSAGVDTGAW